MSVQTSTTTARSLMAAVPATTTSETTVADFARRLLEEELSGAPVVAADGSLLGMASDLDLISKRGATVGDIMSRGLVAVSEDATIEEIVRLMGLHGIRRVPVVRDGKLIGSVGRREVLAYLFAEVD